jgi:hypothetical protein
MALHISKFSPRLRRCQETARNRTLTLCLEIRENLLVNESGKPRVVAYGSAGFGFNFFVCVICGVANLRQKCFGFSIRTPSVPRAFIIWLAHAVNVVRPAARRLHIDRVRCAKGWHLGITLGVCMSGSRPG